LSFLDPSGASALRWALFLKDGTIASQNSAIRLVTRPAAGSYVVDVGGTARGKAILDTCGGLGYTAAACLKGGATRVLSYEKNEDVIWLRSVNPWSPQTGGALALTHGDVTVEIAKMRDASVDAILHDPPRFGIAGELYSQAFYDQLARVLGRKGLLFHYTGSPNKLTTGRDVPREVAQRLRRAGFVAELHGDGVLATKAGRRKHR